MVVIKGLAITAGSKPIFLASIGKEQPITFATITVKSNAMQTTAATRIVMSALSRSLSISSILTKVATARVSPQRTETLISFQITHTISLNSISPSDIPRITVTDAWLPELPPVPMSMGIKEVSTTCAARALSNPVIIIPVNVAETISRRSHGILESQICREDVLR